MLCNGIDDNDNAVITLATIAFNSNDDIGEDYNCNDGNGSDEIGNDDIGHNGNDGNGNH